jgi:hypothetical protein
MKVAGAFIDAPQKHPWMALMLYESFKTCADNMLA